MLGVEHPAKGPFAWNPTPRGNVFVEGIFKRYPEIGDRPKKVLSNPPGGSIEPLKWFYRTPEGSIEPPFRPQKGCIEPLWEVQIQNHRQGSIEPFVSNPPF